MKIWKIDLKFEFEMLSILLSMLKNRNWFAKSTDVIFENFQKSRMIQILIWNCQYWKFCRKIDWFSISNIEIIVATKKKCRFAMMNKYILWLIFEWKKWFQCWLFEKILQKNSNVSRRNIELIEWIKKRSIR